MLSNENGTPVHTPAKPDKFEFDNEVARIFPDMAVRSIPNFIAAHDAHAAITKMMFHAEPGMPVRILDIGASRGHFYGSLMRQYQVFELEYIAVDVSQEMCDYLKAEYPWLNVKCIDITALAFDMEFLGTQFDVVCCNYVLQFLPPEKQIEVLAKLLHLLGPGGLFFLGHKSDHSDAKGLGSAAHEVYYNWRISNGYTRAEIETKARALKGSMFPMNHEMVIGYLEGYGMRVQETTRYMMFSTLAAQKV
jgi:tRNA (cmo5U34)-methyltransferase